MKIKKTDILTFILKNMFVSALVIFLGIYISLSNGTNNYKAYKKSVLTAEKIKQFEEDVKNGKNITIENYIDTSNRVSSNKISKAGTYLSEKITTLTKTFIKATSRLLEIIFGE